jgi:hypothetical protein
MPLQPRAEQEMIEKVMVLARVFKAGYRAAVPHSMDIHPVEAPYDDFKDWMRENYDEFSFIHEVATRELFDAA